MLQLSVLPRRPNRSKNSKSSRFICAFAVLYIHISGKDLPAWLLMHLIHFSFWHRRLHLLIIIVQFGIVIIAKILSADLCTQSPRTISSTFRGLDVRIIVFLTLENDNRICREEILILILCVYHDQWLTGLILQLYQITNKIIKKY